MTIFEKIKAEHRKSISYRDRGVIRKYLSFVLGELENKYSQFENSEKTYPDKLVIKGLKSIIKTAEKNQSKTMEFEVKLLNGFLPVQLTEKEIRNIFETKIPNSKLKEKMAYLNQNHAGYFNGKLASDIAKSMGE